MFALSTPVPFAVLAALTLLLGGCIESAHPMADPLDEADDVVDEGDVADASPPPPIPLACDPLPEGLVGWWRGEGDGLDSAREQPTALDDRLAWDEGVVGRAFDTRSAWAPLTVLDPRPFLGRGGRTFEAWIRADRPDATLFAHYECGGACAIDVPSPSAFLVQIDPEGVLRFQIRDADTPPGIEALVLRGDTRVDTGEWHHVAAVLDVEGGEARIYVDGRADGWMRLDDRGRDGFFEDRDDEVDPLTIGWLRSAGDGAEIQQLDGLIDEVGLYTRALGGGHIAGIFAAGPAGKCGVGE